MSERPTRVIADDSGAVWAVYVHRADAIEVEFPGFATFSLSSGQASCIRRAASDDVIEHLYQNQIVPLLWSQRGNVALHASAVVDDGQALVFVGDTGQGKSTLAVFLASLGLGLITDDTLLIERRSGKFMALPGSDRIRLWHDSGGHLLGPKANQLAAFDYTSKGRFDANEHFNVVAEPTPIKRVFFLGSNDVDSVVTSPFRGRELLFACTRASFLLDWMDPEATRTHFDNVSAFCREVETFRLDYPRRYEELDHVADAVLSAT